MNPDPQTSPLVSIAMCVYNTRNYIEQAIGSVIAQTYTNWELIISDDGSSDGTREYLRALETTDARFRFFYQDRNIGYVKNKNFALAQTRGDYITQNDSDDFSDTTRIEKQMTAMLREPDTRMVGCGYCAVDEAGSVYGTHSSGTDQWIPAGTQLDYPFWFPSLMVHRSLFDEFGYFSSLFCGMGDDHYWTVTANERYPIYCLAEPLYYYRSNPHSITNVLNDPRKLIISPLLEELFPQRRQSGSDWLQQGDDSAIHQFEQKLLQDGRFMSERNRLWAAKYIDRHDFEKAGKLLGAAFRSSMLNMRAYQTAIYYLRKRLSNSRS